MAYSDAVYEKANNELTRRRQNAEYVFEQHREEIEKKYPQYIELALSLAGASSEIINTVTNAKGNKEIIKNKWIQTGINLKVQEEINIFKQGGYPDYLEIKYTCSLCDSGIYDNHRCSCMRICLKISLRIYLNAAFVFFDTFDLNYYSKETVNTYHIQMQKIFDYCKEYAKNLIQRTGLADGETGLERRIFFGYCRRSLSAEDITSYMIWPKPVCTT